MGKMTRREFLRGGAAMAAGLAAAGLAPLLPGCGVQKPAAEVVVPTTPPTPEMTPVPSFAPDAVLYETTVGMTNCYSAPGEPADGFLGVIPDGVQAAFLGERGKALCPRCAVQTVGRHFVN